MTVRLEAPHHQGIVTAANKLVGYRRPIPDPQPAIHSVPSESLDVVHGAVDQEVGSGVIVVGDHNPVAEEFIQKRFINKPGASHDAQGVLAVSHTRRS